MIYDEIELHMIKSPPPPPLEKIQNKTALHLQIYAD